MTTPSIIPGQEHSPRLGLEAARPPLDDAAPRDGALRHPSRQRLASPRIRAARTADHE
ncbi:hypothetical protein ACFYVC_38570 [Streptomyces tendae]|uniref:hypothetical protein n=1 Tax=Streptomyces tendae TaxID=1932 RepID=UPI00367FB50C